MQGQGRTFKTGSGTVRIEWAAAAVTVRVPGRTAPGLRVQPSLFPGRSGWLQR